MKKELVEILDEQAHKTGQTMYKSEAHRKSLRHGGAHVWIYNSKGEVLLQLRHPAKVIRPNVWDVSVAGHITAGDTPEVTAVREAKEELNLNLNSKDFTFIGIKKVDEKMPDGSCHRVFNWSYLLKLDLNLDTLKLETDEVSDVRWISVNEFEAELNNPTKSKMYTPTRIEFYTEVIEKVKSELANNE
jgi:isopentenyl-diphosphate Delta-isomerase